MLVTLNLEEKEDDNFLSILEDVSMTHSLL